MLPFGGALCPSVPTSPRSGGASAGTALWPGTAPATAAPSSSAASSRGGGGSPSERAARRSSALPTGADRSADPRPRQAAVRKQLRLRRRKDFDLVFQEGHVLANRLLVLRSVPNELPHNRYGFVTSKRLGKAVVRNRVRRRLRESVRSLAAQPGWDVVVSARARAADADFHQLRKAVVSLFVRAGILAGGAPAQESPS